MKKRQVDAMLALNPRARRIRRGLRTRFQNEPAARIEAECVVGIEEWLAFLWALFVVRTSPSPARSTISNDACAATLLYIEQLQGLVARSHASGQARLRCLETIVDILIQVSNKAIEPSVVVQLELTSTFVLAISLRNDYRGSAPLDDLRDAGRIPHELLSTFERCRDLGQIVDEVRRLVLTD